MERAVPLPEVVVPGKRLGRHVEHDERSRGYGFAAAAVPLVQVVHRRYGRLFNQGNLGSCTGNAIAGALNCVPFHQLRERLLAQKNAVALYSLATTLDSFLGTYPPEDTGSSGLAACKAAVQLKYITAYQHAFGIDQALQALQAAPVITGVPWYEGFDNPDGQGVVKIAGQARGGHEFVVREYYPAGGEPLAAIVGADNSWGTGWGKRGRFFFTVRTWGELLARQGDVTIPLP